MIRNLNRAIIACLATLSITSAHSATFKNELQKAQYPQGSDKIVGVVAPQEQISGVDFSIEVPIEEGQSQQVDLASKFEEIKKYINEHAWQGLSSVDLIVWIRGDKSPPGAYCGKLTINKKVDSSKLSSAISVRGYFSGGNVQCEMKVQ